MLVRIAFAAAVCLCVLAPGAPEARLPATRPGKLPHVETDVKARQVRVACEAVNAEMPLEFFVCANNTSEHEAVLRTAAKASHIHLALLMLGLQPGECLKYDKVREKWIPPQGPPLHIHCEFEKDGKTQSVPAYRMMRNVKTKKPMPPVTWVFCGSRMMEDGGYAADATGYIVTVVNFDLALIDVGQIASSVNETLEWEIDPDVVPKRGSKVSMVIEPAGKATTQKADAAPRTVQIAVDAGGRIEMDGKVVEARDIAARLDAMRAAGAVQVKLEIHAGADTGTVRKVRQAIQQAGVAVVEAQAPLSDVAIDEARVKSLKDRWEKAMAPHRRELASAAQAHYDVINALRREQQRLIDESDRIQRVIDQLQRDYQDLTTPRPSE